MTGYGSRFTYPPGSERGALVDRLALRQAGTVSAAAYRLALSLAFW